MISEVFPTSKVNERAKAQKKISKWDDSYLEEIAKMIDFINSQNEYFTHFDDGKSIDDVNIPSEFADFILPASVRYDSRNLSTNDLLVRVVGDHPCPDYDTYVNACDAFRGQFKKDAFTDMVSIGSLRKVLNLSDVISRAKGGPGEKSVRANGTPFVPIALEGLKSLLSDRYFNDSAEEVLLDYIRQMRF